MKNFKKITSILCLCVLVAIATMIGFMSPSQQKAQAQQPDQTTSEPLPIFEKTVSMVDSEREVEVTLEYKTLVGVEGTIDFEITPEHDEETLEVFKKYVKKSIDSADVGEVFYVTANPSNPDDYDLTNGKYNFKVKLPKFYHNKDVAVIPFADYRTTQRVKSATVDDDGYITFVGNSNAYAYAIVYNGVYKQIILIGIIMLVVLIICVSVKVYCVRKDNPIYKEKKKNKAIQKKKEQHKVNKRIAQELKREKEKLKKNGS